MVLFDAGILIKLVSTQTPLIQQEKLDRLLTTLGSARVQILIPTPALAEFYVKANPDMLTKLRSQTLVSIAPFDEKAAIECGLGIRNSLLSGNKKTPQSAPWQKVKFDHQIVAIAKSNNVDLIYSEDAGLRKFAQSVGIAAICTDDLV
jgi:predicted nucleic acid-binding protein